MSTAKGLALAAQKPLVAVPTLEALAHRFFLPGKIICPMIDARRSEVYAALFEMNGEGRTLVQIGENMVAKPGNVLELINQPAVFSGTGALRYRDIIIDTLGAQAEFAPCHRILPSAEDVAFLALGRFKNNEIADPFTLEPLYIRPSDAEIKKSQQPDT
jgi:tRNA threonylcarbamoyladenosine biosynthesis protein TsaB